MEKRAFEKTASLVIRDFELEIEGKEGVSEEELIEMLADRIAWLLEYRLEYLLSLMYRLDVSEAEVNSALAPEAEEPANLALSRLVVERQKQRVATQRAYPVQEMGEEDWE